MPVEKRFEIF